MKKSVLSITAAILIILQVFGTTGIQVQAAQPVYYAAFGDSITAGDSANGSYVSLVADYLNSKNGNCISANLGIGGWTSSDLLEALTNPSHDGYMVAQNIFKYANVITLDIGSNDIVQAVYTVVAECFGCEINELESVINSWSAKLQNGSWFSRMIAYQQLKSIARKMNRELYSGQTMKEAVEQFKVNYTAILRVINQNAPKAKVYIGNLYNPYHGAESIYVGDYEVFNPDSLAEKYFNMMNTYIAANSSGNVVVDLDSVITSDVYLQGDMALGDYNPHPNAAGNRAIANKFISAMN